jgi:HSP20 family protein
MKMTNAVMNAEKNVATGEHTRSDAAFHPNVDIVERSDGLTVLVDMPGASADGIDVDFDRGTLSIYGKVPPRNEGATNVLLQEYGVGDYFRSFQVSEDVDASRISASYASGVLTLDLPKAEAVKPRRITVAAS